MKRLPIVSFIIPTLNAGFIIEKCFKAIRSQNYPQDLVEIVVADGGSTDNTLKLSKKYSAKIISNPDVWHEPGKALASDIAKGNILFFTDADNILANSNWIRAMVKPYLENKDIVGFLPQTIAAPDSNPLDRYMGYLATDPFTWFMHGNAATPRTYGNLYKKLVEKDGYIIYDFAPENYPLAGLSQGFGTIASFKRGSMAHADDILGVIKILVDGGKIVYVPSAGVYHYHIKGWGEFVKKYRSRIRSYFYPVFTGMGLANRNKYINSQRKFRQFLFTPYALSIVFPLYEGIRLSIFYKDRVLLLHPVASFVMATLIILEAGRYIFKSIFIP